MRTPTKFGLLGALYLSQGLPFGFFTQALPVILRERGVGLAAIGASSLLALPWALKFLWAPVVDRTTHRWGRRKIWIVPLQLVTIAALVVLALNEPGDNMYALLAGIFVLNLLAATQDIATDALAVDLLSPAERGLGNGVQVAGYRVGMIIGGGVLLILYSSIGWTGLFAIMAGIVALATLPVLFAQEPVTQPAPRVRSGLIASFFRQPGVKQTVALLIVYKFGDAFATGMLRPFLVDRGMTLADVGWLLGTVGFVAGLFGALVGGILTRPGSRFRMLRIFAALQAATIFAYAWIAMSADNPALLTIVCGVEHFIGGMATVALFTHMMDQCRPDSRATDYTVQASLVVIATGLAHAISGLSASALGYANHFILAAALSLLALLVISDSRTDVKEIGDTP